jgi:hypothetical protein
MGVVIIANVPAGILLQAVLSTHQEGKVLPAFLGKISKRGQPNGKHLSMYIAFVLVLSGNLLFNISVSSLLMLVNQKFLFLYGFILLSYWKTETAGGAGCIRVFLSFPFLPCLGLYLENSVFCCSYRNRVLRFCQEKRKERKKRKKKQLYRLLRSAKPNL